LTESRTGIFQIPKNGFFELKINYQKGYRVYFTVIKRDIVLILINGGDKSSQSKDIKRAIDIKKYLKQRGLI
jgi:putative addiction module killer protein